MFNLVNLIIDRLGSSIRPYAPGLLQLLPAVWEQAEGQSLLRIQVCLGGRPSLFVCMCACVCVVLVVCAVGGGLACEMRQLSPVLLARARKSLGLDCDSWSPWVKPCVFAAKGSAQPLTAAAAALPQVLVALQRLVNALGPESPACYPLLLPVLRLCTDPAQVRRGACSARPAHRRGTLVAYWRPAGQLQSRWQQPNHQFIPMQCARLMSTS